MALRYIFKRLAQLLAAVLAFPFYVLYLFLRVILGDDRTIQLLTQAMAGLPGIFGEYIRVAALRYLLEEVGTDVVVSYGTIFSHKEVVISDGVYIGAYCVIGMARIGENTLIADGVMIPSGRYQHNIDRIDLPIKDQKGSFCRINIGKDCWIGSNSVIMADVSDGCVVAAGSVVVDKIEPYLIVAGNPARQIRSRKNL